LDGLFEEEMVSEKSEFRVFISERKGLQNIRVNNELSEL